MSVINGIEIVKATRGWELAAQSVEGGRLRSEGVNLFDASTVTYGYQVNNADGANLASTGETASKFILIDPTEDYYISGCSGTTNTDGAYYNSTMTYISGFTSYGALTIPANTAYIRFTVDEDDLDTAQLEKGTAATTYTAYDPNDAFIPTDIVLRSLPNDVKDKLIVTGQGAGEGMQYVSEDTDISGTDYDSLDNTTYTNVDVVKTTAFTLAKAGTSGQDQQTRYYNSAGVELSEVAAADIDLVASVGKYYFHTDKSVWAITAAGAYADIAAARTGLGTSSLNYELATPIPFKIAGQVLKAHSSGRFTWEPILSDEKPYSSGITIPNTDYPFRSTTAANEFVRLDKVTTNDDGTPCYEPLDLANVTIAAGLTSFTSTDLSDGDVVYYERYKGTGAIPSITYSHPENIKAAVDSAITAVGVVDEKVNGLHSYTQAQLVDISGIGRTTETVKGNADSIVVLTAADATLNAASLNYRRIMSMGGML